MIDRRPPTIDAMDVTEIDDIPFDFKCVLIPGEIITVIQVTVLQLAGPTDQNAQAMVVGNPTVGRISETRQFVADANGPVVLQRFSAVGRVPTAKYSLRCSVTLSTGRKLTATGHMTVHRF